MGLFSRRDKIKDTDTDLPVQVNFQDKSNMIAVNPQITGGRVTHRDGKTYALMMFEVSNLAPDGGTIYVTNMNKVLVEKEVNPDGSCSPLTRKEMHDYSVQYINQVKAGYHRDGKICNYIGRLQEGTNQMIISPVVQQMVDNQIEPQIQAEIQARNEQKRIIMEEKEAIQRAEFLESARKQSEEYFSREAQKRNARLQSGRFECVHAEKVGNLVYEDYDGVDISSGDVLRVRNLCKQGKDESKIYLYTANVETTHNEDDVEMLSDSKKAVAFTTPIKIDQLLQTPQGKRKVLELFARANQEARYNDGIKFVGNLDMTGSIYSPYLTHCSPEIQRAYNELNQATREKQEKARQRYANALQKENQQNGNRAEVTPLGNGGKRREDDEEDRDIG